MYSLFCLIWVIFVVNSVTIRHQFEDKHPFRIDDEKKLDKFMLIPSIGYEINNKPGEFNLILNGWYYEPLDINAFQTGITWTFQKILHFLDKEQNSNEEKQERLRPFFVIDVPDHKIHLKLSESISQTVTTDTNGRFDEKITVNSLDGLNTKNQMLKYTASDANNNNNQQIYEGIVYLMKINQPHGCSIISDIDDTIKISEVPDKTKLMVNTFRKDFRPVPGMSDRYQSWRSSHNCLIHYVSAMPAQLYYVTQKFLTKENFPGGSFHMRHLKLTGNEKLDLIDKVLDFAKHESSQNHKLTNIKKILDHAPSTQEFVMVGDSGELDPEIYGEIARNYPERIKLIFIRLVDGGKNTNDRFEKAFSNISTDKWKTFFNANELPQKLYEDTDPINNNGITNSSLTLSTALFSLYLTLISI